MTDESDLWSRLMVASLRGDLRAYERLLRDIVPVVARFIRSRWPSAQAADIDDVVQETLRSLHVVRHTYIAGRPFQPWLFAIARHRLLDHHRALRRRHAREEALVAEHETFSEVATNTVYEGPVSRDVLDKAIARLPARQRMAVRLLSLKQMSLKEAAAHSGMSVAALKVASHRGIKALRKTLGEGD